MQTLSKSAMRQHAKQRRANIKQRRAKAAALIGTFPAVQFRGCQFAGFWPIGDEIDLRPLMKALYSQGEAVCLPITGQEGTGLTFKSWSPETVMERRRYGICEPQSGDMVIPDLIFLPLLAFDRSGCRLGYGGGFYDRTIATLRAAGHEVFACGVGFDTQEQKSIPMESHDIKLDAILTPSGYTRI